MLISLPPELAVSIATSSLYPKPVGQPIFSRCVSSYTQKFFYIRRPSESANDREMPRPIPPPTPGSSSDIRGKEGARAAPTFHLPPAAYQEADRASTSSSTSSANGSDSSYRPISPTSPADLSRKTPATQQGSVVTKDDFALPPPPTRSRKIIQMKPQDHEAAQSSTAADASSPTSRSQNAPQSGTKRKQNNTSSAGRKIARKTAHSLIERRRRSKMNEEFGVLKDMIPACKGQEMHKLAILQVSL